VAADASDVGTNEPACRARITAIVLPDAKGPQSAVSLRPLSPSLSVRSSFFRFLRFYEAKVIYTGAIYGCASSIFLSSAVLLLPLRLASSAHRRYRDEGSQTSPRSLFSRDASFRGYIDLQ